MSQLTANDVLDLVEERAQWCRSEGESDMRNIINFVSLIRSRVEKGIARDEILADLAGDEDDD